MFVIFIRWGTDMVTVENIGESSHAVDCGGYSPVESLSLRATRRRARSISIVESTPVESMGLPAPKCRRTRNSKHFEEIKKMCEENAERQVSFERYLQDIVKQLHARDINNTNMTFKEELQVTLRKHTEMLVDIQATQVSIFGASTNILMEQVYECNEMREHIESCREQLTFLRKEVESLRICNNRLNGVVTKLSRVVSQAQKPMDRA